MEPELIFTITNAIAMVGWLILVVAPRWKHRHIATIGVIGALLALVYVGLLLFGEKPQGGGFSSLAGVAKLFENPLLLMAGWVHYLVFDLFVGTWESADALKNQIPHWLLVPCLLTTLMFGPAGLLLYLIVRFAYTRAWLLSPFG